MGNSENLAYALFLTQKVIVETDDKNSTIITHDCDDEYAHLFYDVFDFDTFNKNLLNNIHEKYKLKYSRFQNNQKEKKADYITVKIKDINGVYHYIKIRKINRDDSTIILFEDVDESLLLVQKELEEFQEKIEEWEKKYNHDVNMDLSTGCYNMNGFNNEKDSIVKISSQSNRETLCCVIDLNGLKYINDTFGHESGDIGIKKIASILKKCVPSVFGIFRKGGDEFAVIGISENCEELEESLSNLFEYELKQYNDANFEKNKFIVDMSYGFSSGKVRNFEDLNSLIKLADKKMYEMKKYRDLHARETKNNPK